MFSFFGDLCRYFPKRFFSYSVFFFIRPEISPRILSENPLRLLLKDNDFFVNFESFPRSVYRYSHRKFLWNSSWDSFKYFSGISQKPLQIKSASINFTMNSTKDFVRILLWFSFSEILARIPPKVPSGRYFYLQRFFFWILVQNCFRNFKKRFFNSSSMEYFRII